MIIQKLAYPRQHLKRFEAISVFYQLYILLKIATSSTELPLTLMFLFMNLSLPHWKLINETLSHNSY